MILLCILHLVRTKSHTKNALYLYVVNRFQWRQAIILTYLFNKHDKCVRYTLSKRQLLFKNISPLTCIGNLVTICQCHNLIRL